MSKTMSKKDQKAIQKAEEIIAEVKQNELKDGAFIVLRGTSNGSRHNLESILLGDTLSAIAVLGAAILEVCENSGISLNRVIRLLLKAAK